jgi:hypothetical protein
MGPSRKYRVRIYGFDPLAANVGEEARVGFWTTRYVEAENSDHAAELAVDIVRSDSHLAEVVKAEWTGEPVVRAMNVVEIKSFEGIRAPGGGYTFFESTDEPQ